MKKILPYSEALWTEKIQECKSAIPHFVATAVTKVLFIYRSRAHKKH